MGTPIVIPAICNSAISVNVPSVVASGIYAAQSANLDLTNIYTPSNTGLYRLSYAFISEGTPRPSISSADIQLTNQDGQGIDISLGITTPTAQPFVSGSVLFYPKSGDAITVFIGWNSGTYDFVYTLEAF